LIVKILDTVLHPHISDPSLLPLHFSYLSTSLLDLFPHRSHAHFLNADPIYWNPEADLQATMETLIDPDSYQTLAVFVPEVVHVESEVYS
jgi:hypothetical protein